MAHDVRIDRTKLHPWLDHKLSLLLKECTKAGIDIIITEGFRTKAYQDKLYAKGRTAPGNIVTNARGSTYSSQHMWGIAFDIAINKKDHTYDANIIKKVAKIAKSKKVGLAWGGDWKSIVDTPHFYLKKWGSTTSKLKSLYGTPSEFKKTWTKTVTGTKNGLTLWDKAIKKSREKVPNGTKVKVMYKKGLYCKVKCKGKVGWMKAKHLK